MAKIILPELSYELMNILFSVHNELGNNYQEKHYQRAIAMRLEQAGISFQKEQKVTINFDGEKIGDLYFDFLIDDKIILEIKTNLGITHDNIKQVLRYLESANLSLGIIANFRASRLEYKRVVHSCNS